MLTYDEDTGKRDDDGKPIYFKKNYEVIAVIQALFAPILILSISTAMVLLTVFLCSYCVFEDFRRLFAKKKDPGGS